MFGRVDRVADLPLVGGLGELHHGSVGLLRLEKRFAPRRVLEVHAHWLDTRGRAPRQRGFDVADLECDVMHARAVAFQEPSEEVVHLGLPDLEQFDRHPGGTRHARGAQAGLEPTEAVSIATVKDDASEFTDRGLQRGLDVEARDRDMIEIELGLWSNGRHAMDATRGRPARVITRAAT